jgi:hypothetical protein
MKLRIVEYYRLWAGQTKKFNWSAGPALLPVRI